MYRKDMLRGTSITYRSMEVKYGPRGGESGFDLEIVTFLCLSPEEIN